LTALLAYVKTKATHPNVTCALHQTWAYQQNSTHSGFANYNKDQTTMYAAILDATTRAAAAENITLIIPSGTAVQNARTSFIGDNLCRDGYHLDYNIGRYTAACTWYETITGNTVLANTYIPPSLSDRNAEVARKAAHSAVQRPLSVSQIEVDLEASAGNFNGWTITATGHDGMNAGTLAFTEKNMTLESWLYIDDAGGKNRAGVNVISNRHGGHQGFSVNLAQNAATGKEDVRFVFKNTKDDGSFDASFTLYLPREAFSNQWGHFAFVISSDEQRAYVYLNGERYAEIEDFRTAWVGNRASDPLWIGRWYAGDPTFYGKMADIRLWTVARTAGEIAEHYNQRLAGTEAGLEIYYNFDNFDQTVINVARPGTNNGSLLPAATWRNVHVCEVLSQKPANLSLENDLLTWEAEGDSWLVELVEKANDMILVSETLENTSFSLRDLNLSAGAEYLIRVRTFNNNVYSDWASIHRSTDTALPPVKAGKPTVFSENGLLLITSDAPRTLDLFAADGRLVRTLRLSPGRNEIAGLKKGFYLAGQQKVLVK
jgi:hypothetical protein